MTDRLLRGHLPRFNIRFALCQTEDLCSEAIDRHQADFLAGWLLSEALTIAALLSVILKDAEKLTLRWGYPGPVGTLLADTNARAEVRGFPQRLRLTEDVGTLNEALGGEGRLSAITSVPNKVLHTGITDGVFRDLPRDMAHLFSVSYQVETAFSAGLIVPPTEPVRVRYAVGLMLQPFPNADMEAFQSLRGIVEGAPFRSWLEEEPRTLETVMRRLEGETGDWHMLGELEPRFACGCTRDKVASVLRMFEPAELEDMVEKEGGAAVNCHFCAESYSFGKGELQAMIQQSQSGRA